MEKKLVGTILGVVALIVVVAGTTAAWFTWSSDTTTDVSFTVAGLSDDVITTNVSAAGTLTGTLTPVGSKANGVIKTFKVTKDNTKYADPIYLSFTLALTSFNSGLAHASLKWEFVSVSGSNETTLGSGNFASNKQGDTVKLITLPNGAPVRHTLTGENNYKLYIWIDGTMDNPYEMQSKDYKFTLTIDGTSEPNAGI